MGVHRQATDEPLRNSRQFFKHIGRKLAIETVEEEEFEGILKGVEGAVFEIEKILESKKGKPMKTEIISMKMEEIKETKVLISFK